LNTLEQIDELIRKKLASRETGAAGVQKIP
jgi:hypothetical protein